MTDPQIQRGIDAERAARGCYRYEATVKLVIVANEFDAAYRAFCEAAVQAGEHPLVDDARAFLFDLRYAPAKASTEPVGMSEALTPDECRALRVALIFGDPKHEPPGRPDLTLESAKRKLRQIEAAREDEE